MAFTTDASRIRLKLLCAATIMAFVAAPAGLAAQGALQPARSSEAMAVERRMDFGVFGMAAATVRDSLVTLARQQLGRRYVLGGTTPDKGFDCSGLIRYVLAKLDIAVPRTAAQQEGVGATVAKDTAVLRPGDLLTFGRGNRATHIGIYVGDGRFIHASSHAGQVVESRLIRPPARLIKPWRGARRILAGADSVMVASSEG
ncbi:MAG TPA: C40 family peptidase [Gemmatimonadaceae bacterium]|nr:C40 family peptidase [Gemmatimonadaceae bacterium]